MVAGRADDALGVTPYGVADIPNYNLWVNEPKLPDSRSTSACVRSQNLELLTQMKSSFLFWVRGLPVRQKEVMARCAWARIRFQRR